MPQITQVWQENFCVYGADKIWRVLNRMGTTVARCTVERLMQRLQIQGVLRGKKVRTTIPDELADRPSDLVNRQFKADRPNQLWGLGLHLCFHLARLVVRRFCDRCLRQMHRWLASE